MFNDALCGITKILTLCNTFYHRGLRSKLCLWDSTLRARTIAPRLRRGHSPWGLYPLCLRGAEAHRKVRDFFDQYLLYSLCEIWYYPLKFKKADLKAIFV